MGHDDTAQDERSGDDWSTEHAHGERPAVPTIRPGEESERWHLWYLGIYLGIGLLIAGAASFKLAPIVVGLVLLPVAMELDARFLETVTPGWQRDSGLIVLGSLLLPFVVVPYYLYQRRELT